MKKGGIVFPADTPPTTPEVAVLGGKRSARPASKPSSDSIKARFMKVIEAEAAHAGPEKPGPNSMKRLTESEKDREAFFIWAFQQNPDLLILLSRFLCYGWRSSDAMAHITGLIREAAGLAQFSTVEARMAFMKKQFYDGT